MLDGLRIGLIAKVNMLTATSYSARHFMQYCTFTTTFWLTDSDVILLSVLQAVWIIQSNHTFSEKRFFIDVSATNKTNSPPLS